MEELEQANKNRKKRSHKQMMAIALEAARKAGANIKKKQ